MAWCECFNQQAQATPIVPWILTAQLVALQAQVIAKKMMGPCIEPQLRCIHRSHKLWSDAPMYFTLEPGRIWSRFGTCPAPTRS